MIAPSLDSPGKDMECEDQSMPSSLDIIIKWNGNDYDVKNLNSNSDVKTLKEEIFKCTGVRPERQKLINLRILGKYFKGRVVIILFCAYFLYIFSKFLLINKNNLYKVTFK